VKQNTHIIILGGGQTAAYASKEIRKIDTSSKLTIISEEKYLPYERPPLSKDCLLGKMNFDQCLFFPESFYLENKIEFINNTKIIDINFEDKKLFSSKNFYSYSKLLIATGSTNRNLIVDEEEILPDENLIYLRNVKESETIKSKMKSANNILIIGGGFIGLEIASSASQLGKKVTILERRNQLMGRVIPSEIAKLIQDRHQNNGTKIYLSVEIKKINKNQNNSYEVLLDSDEKLETDLLIIGIGSSPDTTIYKNKSLDIDNGIITNEFSQTSIENVFAAGDVANFFHPFYGLHMRLESFKHAQNHGINAGKNIVGKKTSYTEIPWMWSDQFELNLQMTGICSDYETIVQRGNSVKDGIIYFFLKNRRIIGACGVGIGGKIGRDIRLAGKLSKEKIKITKEILSNKNQKLNKIS
jgi:3-phenylpropionate/trans-cinnamate dioxygenase ferredoxin reductase subunit